MLISDLDAVNSVLRELGEQPLTTLDTSYPTADLAKTALNTARLELLQKGWWFNTIQNYSVTPNDQGLYATPENTLEFTPNDSNYVWSGQYIMDSTGNVNLYNQNQSIKGTLRFNIKLQALPWTAQQLVVTTAASKVYVSDFGPDTKYQELAMRIRELTTILSSQHIRAKRPNMLQRPEVARYYMSLRT